uniref:ladderlectin-like n=1 Tax=Semicossyphus pulcher TaxID=241346 RepID=UPI0037E7EAA7
MKALLLLSVLALTAAAVVDDELPVPEEEDADMFAAAEMDAPAQGRFFTCPAGWARYKNTCYLYASSSRSWSAAEYNCARLGASLASVHDVFDYSFLQSLTRRAGSLSAWTGGFYFQGWRWADQSRFSYSNWSSMNSVSSYQCIYVHSRVGWSNGLCASARPSICMKRTDSC